MANFHYETVTATWGHLWHEVAVGLWFPQQVKAVGQDDGMGEGYKVEATFSLDADGILYQLTDLLISAKPNEAISARALKALRFRDLEAGLGDLGRGGPPKDATIGSQIDAAATFDNPNKLIKIAHVYSRAHISGHKPAEAVKDALGVKISTAGYWIRQARQQGFLRTPRSEQTYTVEHFDEAGSSAGQKKYGKGSRNVSP